MRSIQSYYSSALNLLASFRDFRTKRHIVVFESDDWGSIRMPSKEVMIDLTKQGYFFEKKPYEKDTLESSSDLIALFEVYEKYKDINGHHPIITANMLMANPDFNKIKADKFSHYHYEPVAETYKRYYGDAGVLNVMKQGLDAGVFMPQSHGREHFNARHWIIGLQNQNEDLLTAFQYGMCGIVPKKNPEMSNELMKALRASDEIGQDEINKIVSDGLDMFEVLWGFKSRTFVAPCYSWSIHTEDVLAQKGVKMLQTARKNLAAWGSEPRHFYTGKRNKWGQFYSVRNCSFEPVPRHGGGSVDNLMAQVDGAFKCNKLAIFSTHRINYVGGIDVKNRDNTLHLLDEFLKKLQNKYPDVEFMSSDMVLNYLHIIDKQ